MAVKGSLIAGENDTVTGVGILNGSLTVGGPDFVGRPIKVTVGNMLGHVGAGGVEMSPVIETYTGFPSGSVVTTVNVTVKNDMVHGRILGGYNLEVPFMQGVSLGAVVVGGDFIASDIVAGVSKGMDAKFGTGDDAFFLNPSQLIGSIPSVTRIASIVIGGNVVGTSTVGDSFAIEAEQIGKLSIGGSVIPLTLGKSNDSLLLGRYADLRIAEIVRP